MSKEIAKSNSRLKIAVVALACAFILSFGGMIGIWAATQQTVSSSFTVSYSIGDNVAIAVGANSRSPYHSREATWFTSSDGYADYKDHLISLYAPETSDRKLELVGGDLQTTPTGGLRIAFYFENLNDEAPVAGKFIDGARTNDETHGMECIYHGGVVSSLEVLPDDIYSSEGYTGTPDPAFILNEENDYTYEFEIPAQSIYCVSIIVMPAGDNVNKSAKYVSNANGGISFVFGDVE